MNDAKKTKRKDIRRRALAAVCAITIAVLQCAVVLTIDTESAYGADIGISMNVIVTNDQTPGSAAKTVSLSPKEFVVDVNPETGEKTTVNGRLVGDFVGKLSLSESPDTISPSNETSSSKISVEDAIVSIDGSLYVYKKKGGGDIWEPKGEYNLSGGLDLEMKGSYSPIRSITISPTSFTPEKGKAISFTASVGNIDSLFESDQANYFKVKWSKDGPATITSSTDTDATITPNGEGTITVSAKLTANESVTAGSSGTIEAITKPTTVNLKDIGNATIHSDGKLEKGKSYSNSEMKEHLTLKDPNDKTIDKKYWDVKSVSRDENEYSVIIKGKNGYTGLNESTVKATKSGSKLTAKYKYTTRKYSGGGVTRSTRINGDGGETTSSLPPNVTYAPDRTITVKEVFLGPQIQEEPQETTNPWDNTTADDWNDSNDDWSEADMEDELYLDFGPAAGSAAAAAAACGAGMVGRIRRFRVDTRAASAVASQTGKTKKLKLKK